MLILPEIAPTKKSSKYEQGRRRIQLFKQLPYGFINNKKEECAMVAQDSPSSEDLDDSIVTFGQQNTEKENFEKMHYDSLFEQESNSEEEMSYNYPGKTTNESAHITKHPVKKVFAENTQHGTMEIMLKQLLGENQKNNIKEKS